MKKTSSYARKRRHIGPVVTFNGAEWLNTVNAARSYSEAPVSCLHSTKPAATRAELVVQLALQGLLDGKKPSDPERDHDLLAHALGITVIRALQIQPDESNPMLHVLADGTDALKRSIARFEASGAWGMDGPGRLQLVEAVDLYAQVLHLSSPSQMAKATEERLKILRGKTSAATTQGKA